MNGLFISIAKVCRPPVWYISLNNIWLLRGAAVTSNPSIVLIHQFAQVSLKFVAICCRCRRIFFFSLKCWRLCSSGISRSSKVQPVSLIDNGFGTKGETCYQVCGPVHSIPLLINTCSSRSLVRLIVTPRKKCEYPSQTHVIRLAGFEICLDRHWHTAEMPSILRHSSVLRILLNRTSSALAYCDTVDLTQTTGVRLRCRSTMRTVSKGCARCRKINHFCAKLERPIIFISTLSE